MKIQTKSKKCQNRLNTTSLRKVSTVMPEQMHLYHHDEHPKESNGDVESMGSDKSKEGGEKSAPLPAISLLNQMREFMQFDGDKGGPQ